MQRKRFDNNQTESIIPVMVVTGGSSGIGLATAVLWEELGGKAALLDIVPPANGNPIDQPFYCPTDVRSETDVANALRHVRDQFGRIDAVFHNAGILGREVPFEDHSLDEWQSLFDVHLSGGVILSKHSLPYLKESGGGAVVFNASIVALNGSPSNPAYAAAKSSLVSLTLSLARALGRFGIRVNAVCPGSVIGTSLLERARGYGTTTPELANLVAKIPLGRVATPQNIAEAVCFLASTRAAHITGAVLPIDGGERLGR